MKNADLAAGIQTVARLRADNLLNIYRNNQKSLLKLINVFQWLFQKIQSVLCQQFVQLFHRF